MTRSWSKCIKACHRLYNVPDIGNPKEEIKWIWKETYEHTFPGQENEYIAEKFKARNFLVLCNHCTNPPCCRACPTKATWKREDGDRDDGHASLHRVPVLHGRLPVWGEELQLGRSRLAPKELNPDFPTNSGVSPPGPRGWWRSASSARSGLPRGRCRPAWRRQTRSSRTPWCSETWMSRIRDVRKALRTRYSIRRKPELGTGPNVYYIV